MIKSFKHKGLKLFYERDDVSKLPSDMVNRITARITMLENATSLLELNVPSHQFHKLKGYNPPRYTIHVNGPYCLTFAWDDGVIDLNLENYH